MGGQIVFTYSTISTRPFSLFFSYVGHKYRRDLRLRKLIMKNEKHWPSALPGLGSLDHLVKHIVELRENIEKTKKGVRRAYGRSCSK